MTEAVRTLLLLFVPLALGATIYVVRISRLPASSPERLIAELRFAQVMAIVLMINVGAYVGFAASHENTPGIGFDIALAFLFLMVAIAASLEDPRRALTLMALAFAAHAIVDVGHRPGFLPEGIAPRWYAIGCAVLNVYMGALCYLPILRR